MLNNKADVVERHILDLLAQAGGKQVELKRIDLASEVRCAPSQISYVLNTRFTYSRGFKVESQRGLGGFIRITILQETDKDELYREIAKLLENSNADFVLAKNLLDMLLDEKLITVREAEIIAQMLLITQQFTDNDMMTVDAYRALIKKTFSTLSKVT